MSKILIAYGTSEGQTAKIAQQLAGFIQAQGHDAFTGDIARGAPAPAGYQAVIVGASVHKGKHQRWVVDYVRRNRPALERLPSAFFSVSLAIQDGSEKGRLEAEGYVETFVNETSWYPEKVGSVRGSTGVHEVQLPAALGHAADRALEGESGSRHRTGLRLHGPGCGKALRR